MTEDFKILNIYCIWFLKHESNNTSLCCAYLLSHVWLLANPIVHGDSAARILEWVAMPSSRASSQPSDWTWFPALQADSLPSEPPGKPKNTGVGSLSFLQGNFPTQESNWGLLHCWQILYQLSYMGSPNTSLGLIKCCMNNDTMLINFKECHHFYRSAFSNFMCL